MTKEGLFSMKLLVRLFLFGLLITSIPLEGARAQSQELGFTPSGAASLATSTSSSRVALPSSGANALITNTGSVTVYVKFGDVTVVATSSDYPIPAGASVVYARGQNGYIAGLAASSTSTLLLTTGSGIPHYARGGGGSSGVTIGSTAISGGTDTRVLFNDGGNVGEDAGLTFSKATGLIAATKGAFGGATIGTNALAVTGNLLLNSNGITVHNSSVGSYSDFGFYDSGSTNRAILMGGAAVGMQWYSNYRLGWSASASGDAFGSVDVNLSRSGAGVLQLGTTAANALGSLNLTNLTASGNAQITGTLSGSNYVNWDGSAGLVVTANAGTIQLLPSGGGTGFKLTTPNGASGVVQLGAIDVASGAVAQTLQVQSNTGAATTGPDFSINGSKGTTAGGDIVLQTASTTTLSSTFRFSHLGVLTVPSHVFAGGSLVAGAAQGISFSGRSVFASPSDGILEVTNNAGTDFSRLQLGGTTASFPALKRSTTSLLLRLADDSAYGGFDAGTYSVGGVAGVDCTGITAGTVTVAKGIVTHC